jgi:SAM-dependent MidA family methyltransferase
MALLPIPNAESQALSQQLADLIQKKIEDSHGWIDFATFMQMALYTPNLGYYAGGAKKFGQGGDFVTAPEISPLFAKTLALQAAQVLTPDDSNILELGAGTGKLAADLLLELKELNNLPDQYFILEVSAYLREIQRETLNKKLSAELFKRVVWLETLPQSFTGMVLGNEVLDAIPVHLIHHTSQGLQERGVAFENEFIWQDIPLKAGQLYDEVSAYSLPNCYLTEACPAASALVRSLAEMLEKGVILMLDYGFSAREYYHPQRNQGTLMCHYQHYAHSNPLINIGLQDITAHVNFTQIALTCEPISMRVAGYTNQAQFLINCGILDILQQYLPHDSQYIKLAAAAQKLLSPAEMGELFKVIALTKNFDTQLIGFKSGDKTHTL